MKLNNELSSVLHYSTSELTRHDKFAHQHLEKREGKRSKEWS